MTSSQPTQPLTDEGPTSDRDKADMIAARREIQAILDGRLPMDNTAYSAAIVMVLWKAGWRPRHLSTSMDRCDIADGWWRLGQGWRQRFQKAQDEADRLRAELDEAHRTAGAEHGRAAALEAAYREACTARDVRDTEIERIRAENTAQAAKIAAAAELHQPKTIYTEWHEFPVESSKRTICARCTGGDPDDYYTHIVEWPCDNARALGLDQDGSGT